MTTLTNPTLNGTATATATAGVDATGQALAAFTATRDALDARFINRARDVEALLVALIAQANITLVGEPGTAKSALVRALGQSLTGAMWFEHQVAADTPRQAVIGG